MSKVRDTSLAIKGEQELEWARINMPILAKIREEFSKNKPLKNIRIATCLHLEKKTGVLLETLAAGGATIASCSCNPLTTDDKVAAALAKKMEVFAWAGQGEKDYYENINHVLDTKPQIVIDDGCDLIFALHKERTELLENILGGCEETTTGVTRLMAMEKDKALKFPVIAVNNAYSKYLFDNRFGTAESTINAIMVATNKLLAGKTVVVIGYGWCGRGIADRLKGLGANVIVVEIAGTLGTEQSGFHRALEALYSGYRVMSMNEAAKHGDIFISATGNKHVIGKSHFSLLKNRAILANAGHFNVEIDIPSLKEMSKNTREIKDNVTEYELNDGKKIYILSEGRLVNLARPSGQGHPIEIMDGSFGIQALSVKYVAENKLQSKVHDVPKEIDERIAELALLSHNIKLDKPTEEQVKYSQSWEEGT